jgi:hypothetical protein
LDKRENEKGSNAAGGAGLLSKTNIYGSANEMK